MPSVSHDDVLDFVVKEAILARVSQERLKAEKQQERAEFRSSHKDLRSGSVEWQRGMTAHG